MANPLNEFDRMRNHAQRRAEKARAQTQKFSGGRDVIKMPDFVSPRIKADSQPLHNVDVTTEPTKNTSHNYNRSGGLLGMLDLKGIEMDSDRSVILMLLALLSGKNNDSDELLMLALMYIML